MLILTYFIIFTFYLILIWSGVTILRRGTTDSRFQVLLPAGTIFGIALYIFLINATAHVIKGIWGFYIALAIQILFAVVIRKSIPTEAVSFPKKRNYLLFLLTLIIFIPFLIVTSAQGPANTADSFMHYSLAAVFQRGDYPPHVPWQPDYISYYHLGVAEILGAMRAITQASYELLFTIFELVILSCIVIILPWLYKTEKPNFLLFFATCAFGILSLGSFFLTWPSSFDFSSLSGDFFSWLKHLPTLADVPANGYGTQTNLLSFMLFSHRILAIAFFITILALILSPKKGYLYFFLVAILIAALALADESTFVVTIPAIFLVNLLYSKGSLLKSLLFIIVCSGIVVFQGGILSYVIFNPNHTESDILIFPPDQTGPQALYENYRSSRFGSIGSTFSKIKTTSPLTFFNIGIAWRVAIITLLTLFLLYRVKRKDPILKVLLILCLTSLVGLAEFIILIPKGYLHANGSRFLGLSYYFSGLAIIYLIYLFWEKSEHINKAFKWPVSLLKIFIVWTLLITIIPSVAILFPLQSYNWYANSTEAKNPLFTWIGQNIPQGDRILILVADSPSANISFNLSLISQEGVFTPIWSPQFRSFYGADISPTFFDIFYTLNPSLLKLLKVKYLVVSNQYLSKLPKERVADVNNDLFFQPVFLSDTKDLTVLRIQNSFFEEGSEFGGTFTELSQITPFEGSYYIEDPPAIEESMYRSTRLILADRLLYFTKSVAFYNYQVDVTLKYYGENADHYDYLILGKNTDPKTVCQCSAELSWSGLGNNIKLWKTNSNSF